MSPSAMDVSSQRALAIGAGLPTNDRSKDLVSSPYPATTPVKRLSETPVGCSAPAPGDVPLFRSSVPHQTTQPAGQAPADQHGVANPPVRSSFTSNSDISKNIMADNRVVVSDPSGEHPSQDHGVTVYFTTPPRTPQMSQTEMPQVCQDLTVASRSPPLSPSTSPGSHPPVKGHTATPPQGSPRRSVASATPLFDVRAPQQSTPYNHIPQLPSHTALPQSPFTTTTTTNLSYTPLVGAPPPSSCTLPHTTATPFNSTSLGFGAPTVQNLSFVPLDTSTSMQMPFGGTPWCSNTGIFGHGPGYVPMGAPAMSVSTTYSAKHPLCSPHSVSTTAFPSAWPGFGNSAMMGGLPQVFAYGC